MTAFDAMSDETIRNTFNTNFCLLTGITPFRSKGKESDIPIQQFTFINAMAFFHAFKQMQSRGLPMSEMEFNCASELNDLIEGTG